MFPILIRTLIIYSVLVISIKLTGKRQVGEMQLSELITAFLISEVAASPLCDPDIPLVYGFVPILLLVSVEIIISFITTKSTFFKKLFQSPPTVIISNGKLNIHALSKQRLSMDELISSLRLKNVADISKLDFCFLEHDGQISAFTSDDGLTLPIIIDGKINTHFLSLLGKSEDWLKSTLRSDKRKAENIFLMTTDGKNTFYIEKDTKK